ncbi:hypothetical protein Patl1_29681 [Pistacia atlantica]|uniref:Uncharacterized protein n=1 Tax=Pistacia atlantica TaxID=434234 RepID=A0ACC1A7T1_9ROSI|nr:hypothetical protein Patl1_29681 [Pistacia atlantica]
MNSIEFSLRDRTTQNSVISTTSNDLSNWSRLSSLWPLLYGTSCCFIEFASLIGSRFDFDRYGLVPRSSPRQADLILTAGTVTMKMAPSLVRLYEQMPEPKYVIAMGACTITGGMFSTDSYSTVRGVDKLIPVDVYLPGCPPKPEAVIDAITKLRKKISREIYEDRIDCNRRIGRLLLLPITSFVLYAVILLEIMIKNYFINHHLRQKSLRKPFSNTKVQYLPPNSLIRQDSLVHNKKERIHFHKFKNFIVNVKYV